MTDTPDDLVKAVAIRLCQHEIAPGRSFDEQLSPNIQLWQRYEREAREAIDVACQVAANRIEALEAAAGQLLQVQDGLPMTGMEAIRRAEAVRALLKETSHE